MTEKRYEPEVLRERLGELFQDYPGLQVLTMDALYAERDLCQDIVSRSGDYVVRVKRNRPAVLEALATGFDRGELGKPQVETSGRKWGRSRKPGAGGMSLRALERELGINRATVRKYLDAEGSPTRQSRAGPTASSSDTMAPNRVTFMRAT